jgi:hypothetical protein
MSPTDRGRRLRDATGRRAGKVGVAVAVALAGTAITLTGTAIAAPGASAATACINQTFGYSNTYQACVLDEQVMLNDLWDAHYPGPNQLLATDGYYGPHTESDVAAYNATWGYTSGSVTTPDTWYGLCESDYYNGYHGTYWHDAGCASV